MSYESYNNKLSDYNKLKDEYTPKNKAAVDTAGNNKPPVPQRPCNPDRPMAWNLASLDLTKSSGSSATAWAATYTL